MAEQGVGPSWGAGSDRLGGRARLGAEAPPVSPPTQTRRSRWWPPTRQGGEEEEAGKTSAGGSDATCAQGVSRSIKRFHTSMLP